MQVPFLRAEGEMLHLRPAESEVFARVVLDRKPDLFQRPHWTILEMQLVVEIIRQPRKRHILHVAFSRDLNLLRLVLVMLHHQRDVVRVLPRLARGKRHLQMLGSLRLQREGSTVPSTQGEHVAVLHLHQPGRWDDPNVLQEDRQRVGLAEKEPWELQVGGALLRDRGRLLDRHMREGTLPSDLTRELLRLRVASVLHHSFQSRRVHLNSPRIKITRHKSVLVGRDDNRRRMNLNREYLILRHLRRLPRLQAKVHRARNLVRVRQLEVRFHARRLTRRLLGVISSRCILLLHNRVRNDRPESEHPVPHRKHVLLR
mmetsp:Transcript_553/g.644  ORF Transcript_553/g.644 Transcript_553/m.644 type:complete len:315 (-) Transcript_553:291-1235(-)